MSELVFPTLVGQGWSVVKTPIWSTKVQTAVSGKELRAAYYSQPRWKWSLTFNLLRDTAALAELQSLLGFFLQVKGQFDTFYYLDPTDNAVVDFNIGTGDGANKTFAVSRPIGGFTGPVIIDGSPTVKVAGSTTTDYTVSTGTNSASIVFNTAPGIGAAVTWTGTYFYRCRFLSDTSDFENFMRNRWQNKKLEFITLK